MGCRVWLAVAGPRGSMYTKLSCARGVCSDVGRVFGVETAATMNDHSCKKITSRRTTYLCNARASAQVSKQSSDLVHTV